jgi:hypothetical protein
LTPTLIARVTVFGSYRALPAKTAVLSRYPFERVPADLTLTSTATTIPYRGSFTVPPHL